MRPTFARMTPVVSTGSKIKPIQGMLKRSVVVDISCAMGSLAFTIHGLGLAAGYFWWYGYHVPSVRRRDKFYAKLEDERLAATGQE